MSIKTPTFNEMVITYGHQFTELEIGDAYRNGDYDMLIIRLEKDNMKEENLVEKKKQELCERIKEDGYRIDTNTNTIFIPYTEANNINKNVLMLRNDFGYGVQTEII